MTLSGVFLYFASREDGTHRSERNRIICVDTVEKAACFNAVAYHVKHGGRQGKKIHELQDV